MMGDEEYRVGPGRPPLHTRFGAGSAANPQGKTSAQKKAEMANAEKAMQIRGMMLDAVVRKLSQSDLSEDERAMRDVVRDVVDREVRPHIRGWFADGALPARELARQLGEVGLGKRRRARGGSQRVDAAGQVERLGVCEPSHAIRGEE